MEPSEQEMSNIPENPNFPSQCLHITDVKRVREKPIPDSVANVRQGPSSMKVPKMQRVELMLKRIKLAQRFAGKLLKTVTSKRGEDHSIDSLLDPGYHPLGRLPM
jgi:hypothetical protein